MSVSPVKKFEIHLEHDIDEQYQYEPGEVLRGEVQLTNTEEIRVCSVEVQIRGEATVSWDNEASSGGGAGDGQQFSARETYMDTTVELPLTADAGGPSTGQRRPGAGSTSGKPDAVTFGRGEHSFPLEITLPSTLPSSFIGKYGSITYVLKATVREDKLMGLGTTITSEPFLVLRRLDIRDDAELQKSVTVNLRRRVVDKFLLLCGGAIEAVFTVEKTGHLPGDDIVINGEIDNNSRRTIKLIQVSLVLNSTFHARNRRRYYTQVVTKKSDTTEVESGETRSWTSVRLGVPPYIPESRLDGCDMIDIAYELQFKVEFSGHNGGEVVGNCPITIGTIHDERRSAAARRRTWNPNNYTVGGGDPAALENHYETVMGDLDMDDVELQEEVMDRFRHPIEPGEVRQNILYEDFDERL